MEDEHNSYEVTLIRKVPFVTEFLLFLLMPGVVVILVVVSYLMRSSQSPNEMQDILIITSIPERVQYLCFYLGLSTIILYPLYKHIRIYKSAILTLNDQYFFLKGKTINLDIPLKSIRKIYFKEPKNFKGESKEKLIIYIQQTFMKTTTIQLKDFSKADNLMDDFLSIEKLRPRLSDAKASTYIDQQD